MVFNWSAGRRPARFEIPAILRQVRPSFVKICVIRVKPSVSSESRIRARPARTAAINTSVLDIGIFPHSEWALFAIPAFFAAKLMGLILWSHSLAVNSPAHSSVRLGANASKSSSFDVGR